jgi:hypothetical protein
MSPISRSASRQLLRSSPSGQWTIASLDNQLAAVSHPCFKHRNKERPVKSSTNPCPTVPLQAGTPILHIPSSLQQATSRTLTSHIRTTLGARPECLIGPFGQLKPRASRARTTPTGRRWHGATLPARRGVCVRCLSLHGRPSRRVTHYWLALPPYAQRKGGGLHARIRALFAEEFPCLVAEDSSFRLATCHSHGPLPRRAKRRCRRKIAETSKSCVGRKKHHRATVAALSLWHHPGRPQHLRMECLLTGDGGMSIFPTH